MEPRQMTKFKVGDQVERVSSVLLNPLLVGTVKSIGPERNGYEIFTEYEIECPDGHIAVFYETQLRLLRAAQPVL